MENRDRGAGFLIVTLDHGSGQIRASQDNILPAELDAIVQFLQGYSKKIILDEEKKKIKQEMLEERKNEKNGLSVNNQQTV